MMKIETCIDSLVSYAMNNGLAEPVDHQVLTNRLLDLLRLDDYTPSDEAQSEDLEEILAVPGVDGIIVGLNDLSASIDKFGQINDPEVVDMVDQIMTKCKKAGKPFGVSLGYNFELAKFWIDNGASFVSMGFPQDYYFMVGKDAVARIRKFEDEHASAK